MLTIAQNKTLDALEYALSLVEEYDKEFRKRQSNKIKDDKKKEDQGKAVELSSRFSDVKTGYKELFTLQRERAVDFITNTSAFKFADDKIHFNQKLEMSREFTLNMYDSLNTQVIVPVQDKMLLIYDVSLKKASLILEGIQHSEISQKVGEKYNNARVTISKNWMKLDLNNDGKVTITDLITAVRNLRQIVSESELLGRVVEARQNLRERALTYFNKGEKPDEDVRQENDAKTDESNQSSDSVELQNLNDKDD